LILGTERVQADISRSPLCCHSNETRAPIANTPNSAQLGGTPYNSPKLHPGSCSSVGMRRGTADRHTDTQTRVTNIHFASSTTHAKCNDIVAQGWWQTTPYCVSIESKTPLSPDVCARFGCIINRCRTEKPRTISDIFDRDTELL